MVGDGVLDAGVFLSTPSARRATRQARSGRQVAQDISIHALREEGDGIIRRGHEAVLISIHALREEGDPRLQGLRRHYRISIHALREEGDLLNTLFSPFGDGFLSTPSARRATISSGVPGAKQFLFLSTPSARRATGTFAGLLTCPRYFYPRPPRGGRHSIVVGVDHMADISIHALREEGDRDVLPDGDINIQFLSTPSARRATWHWRHCRNHRPISIHALREEGDVGFLFRLVEELYISIHALREEGDFVAAVFALSSVSFLSTPSARRATLCFTGCPLAVAQFLSTPSARRATKNVFGDVPGAVISIHALREEGDENCRWATTEQQSFLSTPSARRATVTSRGLVLKNVFLSTPSARRATFRFFPNDFLCTIFLSTPSARRATGPAWHHRAAHGISIHALREEGDRKYVQGISAEMRFLSTPSARRATVQAV